MRILERAGLIILRYGLVLLLLLWGAAKFTLHEAEAIKPLVENSPLMSWLYAFLSVSGASSLIGVVELVIAVFIAARPWLPRASALASLAAAGMFLTTLSFLVTTPRIFEAGAMAGFLMKDLILLGAALFTAAEAAAAGNQQPLKYVELVGRGAYERANP